MTKPIPDRFHTLILEPRRFGRWHSRIDFCSLKMSFRTDNKNKILH